MTAARRSLIVLSILIAATRFLALSRTLWDWDEALFSMALHDYNVAAHHPHPPGFPLFVALARLIRLVGASDFRALQTVTMLGALLAFPALWLLARTLKLPPVTAAVAATLFSFLPNVWYFGGTAFSDVPAVVAVIASAALLLRGEDRRSYLLGCLLLGVSVAFRPQNVMLGMWPFLWGSFRRAASSGERAGVPGRGLLPAARRWPLADVLLGGAIAASIIIAAYGGAALATGVTDYRNAVEAHRQYVLKIDSYHNPGRPPLLEMWRDFTIDPYHAGKVSTIIGVFAALGLLRFRAGTRHALLTFGPFFFFAWLMLDVTSLSRLSIGYIPLLALLAAEGMRTVAELVPHARAAAIIQVVFLLAILGRLVPWTASALGEPRRHDSPPYAASMWVRRHLDRSKVTVYVHGSMGPFAEYLLGDYRQVPVPDDFRIDQISDARDAWLITVGASAATDAVNFRRPHGRLWNINHHGYFEASVQPLADRAHFLEGWYGEESTEDHAWRWMSGRSTILLPALHGNGELTMRFYVPLDALPRPPQVTITFNGAPVETLTASTSEVARTYTLTSRTGAPNELRIETDGVVNPARLGKGGDTRDLGLQLRGLTWKAR
ncbi:MAG TPA: hypothetical protein VGR02_22260 [Thermoanaerobaculia bacterium]|nr:hypothetical protein [Thermoanaerobaculia bacterium]